MQDFNEPQSSHPARMAPPSAYDPAPTETELSSWPKVIGIICIVIGSLGALVGAIGILGQLNLEKIAKIAPPEQAAELERTIEVSKAWAHLTMPLGVLALALAGLLIVGGAKLVQRRTAAAALLRAYAWVRLLAVIATAVITYKIQIEVYSAEGPSGAQQLPPAFVKALPVIQFVFSLAWGFALPVFLLIWFARRKVKAEVQGWNSRPGHEPTF